MGKGGLEVWLLGALIGMLLYGKGANLPTPQMPPAPPPAAPSGPGVVYSFAQLQGALLPYMSAPRAAMGAQVAEAESGGRSDAICDSCAGVREYSVGPWQLNEYAHPWISKACAMALACAAHAASVISNHGATWAAWSTCRRIAGCY